MTLADLFVRISGDNKELKTALKDSQDSLASFGEAAVAWGGKLAGALGLASLGATAIAAAEDFEQADARIARATGATGEGLKSLQESFRNVYATSAAGADTIVSTMDLIAQRAGAAGPQLEKLTKDMIAISKVGGEDVATMGKSVETAFANWGVAAGDQSAEMAVLQAAAQQAGVGVGQLSDELATAGPVLRQYGYSFDQATALVAGFAKAGVPAEAATRAMTTALKSFAKDGVADPAQAWRDFIKGIQDGSVTFADAQGRMGKSAVQMYDAIRSGKLNIDEMYKSLEDAKSKGVQSVSTLSSEWTKLKHATAAALEPIAAPAMAIAANVIGSMATAVRDATSSWEGFYRWAKAAMDTVTMGVGTAGVNMALETKQTFTPQTQVAGFDLSTVKSGVQGSGSGLGAFSDGADQAKKKADALAQALAALGVSHENLYAAVKKLEPAYALVTKAFEQGKIGADDMFKATNTLTEAHVRANASFLAAPAIIAAYEGGVSVLTKTLGSYAMVQLYAEQLMSDGVEQHEALRQAAAVHGQQVAYLTAQYGPLETTLSLTDDEMNTLLDDYRDGVTAAQNLTLVQSGLTAALEDFNRVQDLAHSLGQKTTFDYNSTMEKIADYRKILEDTGGTLQQFMDLERLELQTKVDAGKATDDERARLQQLKAELDQHPAKIRLVRDTWLDMARRVHDAIVNDVSRAITDVIFQTGKIGDAAKRMGMDVVDIIVHTIVAKGTKVLLDDLASVGGAIGKIAGALGGVAGGAMNAAGPAAGGVASAAGGGTASAAGGIASAGLMSTVGAIGSIGSMVSGIIGNFQMMGMNKTLDLIEASTRYAWITLGQGDESIVAYTKRTYIALHDFILYLEGWLHDSWMELLNDQSDLIKAVQGVKFGNVGSIVNNSVVNLSMDATNAILAGISDTMSGLAASVDQIVSLVSGLAGGSATTAVTNSSSSMAVHIASGAIVVHDARDPQAVSDRVVDAVIRRIPGRLKQYSHAFAPGY